MHEIRLRGLVEPVLANYLAALGIFRAIGAQVDPGATLHFERDGTPVIGSSLDAEAWERWVLEAWEPSVIASPWNSGAGFYGSSKAVPCTDGRKRHGVELVLATTDPRLERYRRGLRWHLAWVEPLAASGEVESIDKAALLSRLRNEAPEPMLPWIEAVGVVEEFRGKRDASFLSLLGTGGNDGRLDLGNNFMLHLFDRIGFAGSLRRRPASADRDSAALLRALLGRRATGLVKDSAGQFAPAGRAAPNASSGTSAFEGDKRVNPWLFLWALEGTLWFRGAATLRLGAHGRGRAAFPFHATRVDAGFGSAAAEKGKDELWLPLWPRPATRLEVGQLFGEARAQVGRRRARSGLDYARAIRGLGAVRGIAAFRRYALLERAGQANIAVQVGLYGTGRDEVMDRVRALDDYLRDYARVARSKDSPPRFARALRRFEDALLELARRPGPARVLHLVAALGAMRREQAAGLPDKAYLGPFRPDGATWLASADPVPELRIAAALAALDPVGMRSARAWLWPGKKERGIEGAARMGLSDLALALVRRRILAHHAPGPEGPCRPAGGVSAVRWDDVVRWQAGAVDEDLARDVLWFAVDLPPASVQAWVRSQSHAPRLAPALSRGWLLLRLATEGVLHGHPMVPLRAPAGVVEAWEAGRPEVALARATHLLRAAGRPPVIRGVDRTMSRRPSRARLATLALPVPPVLLRAAADAVLTRPPSELEMSP